MTPRLKKLEKRRSTLPQGSEGSAGGKEKWTSGIIGGDLHVPVCSSVRCRRRARAGGHEKRRTESARAREGRTIEKGAKRRERK